MKLLTDYMKTEDCAPIFYWLAVCSFLVFSTVILGGAVRLTGSGLSMVDWNLIMGVLPPIGKDGWNQAFVQYQAFPEYQFVNSEMTLSEFKFIYLMEYAHRVLGRVIGLVYFVPFLFFLFTRRLSSTLFARLGLLLLLGALQGGIGWYMVKSGLVDDPHVSQYRLTLHFMTAVVIYALMVRVMVGLLPKKSLADSNGFVLLGTSTLIVLLLMMSSGAMVAGIRAGFIFNTYPLIAGDWIPSQLFAMTPLWKNLFENPVTIQFFHRWFALIVMMFVVLTSVKLIRAGRNAGLKMKVYLGVTLIAVVVFQFFLGVSTLIMRVPVELGVAHQAGAMVLLTVLVVTVSSFLPKFHDGEVDYST